MGWESEQGVVGDVELLEIRELADLTSLCLCLSLSLSRAHTRTHTISLSPTHTLTHTHSLALLLALSLARQVVRAGGRARNLLGREGQERIIGDVELLEVRELAELRREPLQPVVHRRQNLMRVATPLKEGRDFLTRGSRPLYKSSPKMFAQLRCEPLQPVVHRRQNL